MHPITVGESSAFVEEFSLPPTADGPLAGWPDDAARLRTEQFSLAASWAYLNHAATGPLPASHVRAAHQFLDAMAASRPPNL